MTTENGHTGGGRGGQRGVRGGREIAAGAGFFEQNPYKLRAARDRRRWCLNGASFSSPVASRTCRTRTVRLWQCGRAPGVPPGRGLFVLFPPPSRRWGVQRKNATRGGRNEDSAPSGVHMAFRFQKVAARKRGEGSPVVLGTGDKKWWNLGRKRRIEVRLTRIEKLGPKGGLGPCVPIIHFEFS